MPVSIDDLRSGVSADSAAVAEARLELARVEARRARLRREGSDDPQAGVEAANWRRELQQRQRRLQDRRAALHGELTGLAGAGRPAIAPSDVPVALLPVGLETRFRGDELWVRVIPDEIHVEDHERGLTDAEVEAGRAFWRAVWRAGSAEPAASAAERAAWVQLAGAIGNPLRTSWVVERTEPDAAARPAAALAPGDALPEPTFPEPQRAAPGGSVPMARTLPDVFIAIAYRRQGSAGAASWIELARAAGNPVADAVQLGLDPADLDDDTHEAAGEEPSASDDEADAPALPEGMRWIADPAAAEAAGLLIRLPLPAGTKRIDRLVVLGVLGSLAPADAASRLADLLSGHRHSAGLSLVPLGMPTNNTQDCRSGWGRQASAEASFDIERRQPAPAGDLDGALLCRALGIPAAALRGVAHALQREQAAAGRMNALLWPAGMGYWLDSLVQPGPSDALIEEIRQHAVPMVRSRGPLPPLRIGRQPYGVLPVTRLADWQPADESEGVRQVVHVLRQARSWWLDGAARAPCVRAGQDPGRGLLDVLGQSPVSTGVGVRSMVGANASYVPMPFVPGADSGTAIEANRQRWLAMVALRALGVTGLPYLAQLVGDADPIPELRLPYTVDPDWPAERQATAWAELVEYLLALRTRTTQSLRDEGAHTARSLLALLARRSVLLERIRVGVRDAHGTLGGRLVEAHVRIDEPEVMSKALISTTATVRIGDTRSALDSVLAGEVAGADGARISMSEYLDKRLVRPAVIGAEGYAEVLKAIKAATTLAPERAALLLGEAIDAVSYRFDAWETSIATRRLSTLRQARPDGVTLGAWGVVEELERRARTPVRTPPAGAPTPLWADASAGGYIHAPSMAQAATAAVLRSGQLAHGAGDPAADALAVDLSSARVRGALELLDGVRQGQSLGALLGYRAERRLHDDGAHTAVEVVRRLAPPPSVDGQGDPEGVAPRAVCDGLALSRLPRGDVVSAAAVAGADPGVVGRMLDALDDQVDALADLLLAEGVHQIVQGNPERAAAALDTLNRGEGAIAEPDLVRTPRAAAAVTHRVLMVLARDLPAAPGWPADGVRARAEPRLAAWAGHLLGDPGDFTVEVAGAQGTTLVPFGALGMGALDVVFEPMLPRVLRHARRFGAPADGAPRLDDGPLRVMLDTADLIRQLLGRARVGAGHDWLRPQDRGFVSDGPPPDAGSAAAAVPSAPDVDAGDRRSRLDAARAALAAALAALPASGGAPPAEGPLIPLLDQLAGFGLMPGGDPALAPDPSAVDALRAQAQAMLDRSNAEPDDAALLFGDEFRVLPLVAPQRADAVSAMWAADPLLAVPDAVLAPLGGRAQALASWIETRGRVRAPLGRLADLLLALRLRRADSTLALRAAQWPALPFPAADAARRAQWVGVDFPPREDGSVGSALGSEPVTSVVAATFGSPDPSAGVALLVVDEFIEAVPARETTTGVAFGFDAPGARPAQSILLAVPPVVGRAWTVDSLAQLIGDVLDSARIRMVDLSSVAWAGRLIPTIHLTDSEIAGGAGLGVKGLVREAFARWLADREP